VRRVLQAAAAKPKVQEQVQEASEEEEEELPAEVEPAAATFNITPKLKAYPSVDLHESENIIQEVSEQEIAASAVSAAAPAAAVVAPRGKKKETISQELILFLNSCGIDDESLYDSFGAFGVQFEDDLSELIDQVRPIHRRTILRVRVAATISSTPSERFFVGRVP
jgi:hypothetical protein